MASRSDFKAGMRIRLIPCEKTICPTSILWSELGCLRISAVNVFDIILGVKPKLTYTVHLIQRRRKASRILRRPRRGGNGTGHFNHSMLIEGGNYMPWGREKLRMARIRSMAQVGF